ncbi:hypothetical protein E2C01_081229 [Portunus trituberculatus]|uniref:Secreted protein n=1 Tax=Portunus trituberculatus TaxID=210409 RepID=A0A5B7IVQ3_PORTR|nr:hypothetical protein [Portunus trituberculatus]
MLVLRVFAALAVFTPLLRRNGQRTAEGTWTRRRRGGGGEEAAVKRIRRSKCFLGVGLFGRGSPSWTNTVLTFHPGAFVLVR